jgi:acylphosphatase
VEVTGRVQGVFFRETCRRMATHRGVAGWVRNRRDGTVEAVFEGPAEDVDAMVAWCGQGPAYARVESVTSHPEEPEGLTGFRVR